MTKETIKVPADDRVQKHVWQIYGLTIASEALGGAKPKSILPGFALAVALIDKEIADMRCSLSNAVYRAAARAGHDLSNVATIHTNFDGEKPVIELGLADLVDQAEQPAA